MSSFSIFLLLFNFVSYSHSSLHGSQPNFATCSEVSHILKCRSKIWDIPSLKNWGPKSTVFNVFQRICNIMSTFVTNIFRKKHDLDNQGKTLEITKRWQDKCHQRTSWICCQGRVVWGQQLWLYRLLVQVYWVPNLIYNVKNVPSLVTLRQWERVRVATWRTTIKCYYTKHYYSHRTVCCNSHL